MIKKVLVITAVLFFVFTSSLYAHPPADIEMNFNLESHLLEVTIAHSSDDNTAHFVKNVEVYLNDNLQVEQNFIVQTNNEKQYLHYLIPGAKSGDSIRLTADCSNFGNKEKEIEIE